MVGSTGKCVWKLVSPRAKSETPRDNWKTLRKKRERTPGRRRERCWPKNRSTDRPKSERVAAAAAETVREMGKQMVEIKEQMTEELQRAHDQLEIIATNATDGAQRSYAGVTPSLPFLPETIRTPQTRSTARSTFREQKVMMPDPQPGRSERQWRTKSVPN
ncbi:Uncharacterized protein HZ326_29978 [Fusarium oxysporum f. sp. albedinis]|nr:Uncharacterized protein HZ326_29978 [Fusarium oxysporum f. sp. albedinis]